MRPPQVSVVSGSYGAGHDAVARELAAVLEAAGCRVAVLDVAHLLPAGLGELLKQGYYTQLRVRPGTWGRTLDHLEPGQPLHRATMRLLALGTRATLRAVGDADLVVATHPFAGQILGRARQRGRLAVPTVTYLTDPSVHPMWVHPHVDLHLAIHDLAADQARRWGGRTVTVRPVTPARLASYDGHDALAALGVIGPRALVTGGSLGIGELEETARDILATGVMTPIVACGHNDGLRARITALPGAVGLGWRDDLCDVIASVECVVQNAGGFTSLEALTAGTPVLTYRPIPGHGVTNAANLERAGLAPWPRDVGSLGKALVSAMAEHPDHCATTVCDAPTVVEVLTGRHPVAPAGVAGASVA